MTFKSDHALSRKFRRADYRREPNWQAWSGKRHRRILAALLLPIIFALAAAIFIDRSDPFLYLMRISAVAILPTLVAAPIAIVGWKNDHRACVSEAGMHTDDAIMLTDAEMVYTFQFRNDPDGERYEYRVPFHKLDRVILLELREILVIYAGGTLVTKDPMDRIIKRSTYTIEDPMRLEIPLVYRENEQLIAEIGSHCEIQKSNAVSLDNV